jgi:lipopolysaccharide biosynthesis glycosyltransferase
LLPGGDPIVLACAADDRYVEPLATMIQSVLVNLNAERRIALYVLDGGVSVRHQSMLSAAWTERGASVRWLPADESWFAGVPLWGRMPVTTYLKLALTRLLPPSVRKLVWLDVDLVVLADLARLWDLDLGNRSLLAAQDQVVPFLSSPFGVTSQARLPVPENAKYFNAGVMLVNLERWRDDDIPGQALEFLRRFRDSVYFWDQEALNAVLAQTWGELDPRWNANVGVPGEIDGEAPFIVHFAGKLKPWLYPSRDPARMLYYKYLDMTVWEGSRPRASWLGRLVALYETSVVRRALLPTERCALRLQRAFSRRYVT